MSLFLSGDVLRNFVVSGAVIEAPPGVAADFVEKRLKGVCYELSLGTQHFISTRDEPTRLRDNQTIKIDPGEFAIVTTAERVKIPESHLGILSMKFGLTGFGLINVSGFHVDPGFEGRLHFSIYHAGSNSVILQRLQPMFMLFLTKITLPVKYLGKHQGQNEVPPDVMTALKGPSVSLKQIDTRLNSVEQTVRILIGLVVGLLVAAVGVILRTGGVHP